LFSPGDKREAGKNRKKGANSQPVLEAPFFWGSLFTHNLLGEERVGGKNRST